MTPAGEFGSRLSDEDYDRAIVNLYRGMGPRPTADEDRAVRRRALDLAIDHRLGREFPPERRDALWAASERVESRRVWLGLRSLIGLFSAGRRHHASAMARALAREYGCVLSHSELERFFGRGPYALPIDTEPRRERKGRQA